MQVPNVLSANVAGTSTRGEIDFLDFCDPSRSLPVSVRSTGPYVVTLAESLNGSVMLREGARGNEAADRIPYVVTLVAAGARCGQFSRQSARRSCGPADSAQRHY